MPLSVFSKAQRHLARRDPVLKKLIQNIGPCTVEFNPNGFAVLVKSILSQQISTRAAEAIRARLHEALMPEGIETRKMLNVSEELLRGAGLSAAKAKSLLDLAEKVHNRAVPLEDLPGLADDEVIQRLILVRGIGTWTAQMYLIFSLGRMDVLPVADWGLRIGVQRQYALPEPPNRSQLEALADPWRPYRSIATWYIWRSLGVTSSK